MTLDHTSANSGSSGPTDAWAVESELPSGNLKIGIATFGIGREGKHMCTSEDRRFSTAHNEYSFCMNNMIPQASNNNQGLWAIFEGYGSSMASDGSKILMTSGSSNFTSSSLSNGMVIPDSVWKIAVKVPGSTAAAPITIASRVIAIVTPNVNTGLGTWQSQATSFQQFNGVAARTAGEL